MQDSPLGVFLNPWTTSAIVLSPVVFQYAKALVRRFLPEGSTVPKTWAALLHVVTVASVVVWQGVVAGAAPLTIAGQAVLGLIAAEMIYTQSVEKMADSSHPLMPRTSGTK